MATIPESIIENCLQYGMDDIYRDLRIPQLEYTAQFTVAAGNNLVGTNYSAFSIPEDLTEFIYLRRVDLVSVTASVMYNQVNDIRTFLDPWAETYDWSRYVWKDFQFLVKRQLEIGDTIELHYYRRLGQLDAVYSVIPANWSSAFSDASQPLLTLLSSGGTLMYKSGTAPNTAIFLTQAEADAWAVIYGSATVALRFEGKEAWNWLRDANERVCIYAALKHIGAYLNDPEMEKRYDEQTSKIVTSLNREEKYRRAKGGNVQVNVNTGGMI
jgi:hypothetical protein